MGVEPGAFWGWSTRGLAGVVSLIVRELKDGSLPQGDQRADLIRAYQALREVIIIVQSEAE